MKIEVVDDDTSAIMAEKSNAGMSRMAEESYNEARALVNTIYQLEGRVAETSGKHYQLIQQEY